jgi:hypothetical protein
MADAAGEEWKTYDDFAHGIDTYRKPNVSFGGKKLSVTYGAGSVIDLNFLDDDSVEWSASGDIHAAAGTVDPYDAVSVREGVFFINMPLTSRDGESITIVFTRSTNRAIVTHSMIAAEKVEGTPQVQQSFWAGSTDEGATSGEVPHESRDLIGMRNVYRYSPNHLYEHVYISSTRYAWQCLQGAQFGHGDMDLSTVWKLDHGLYMFTFREFRISVASVWLHDLGYGLNTTGVFLGISAEGTSMHSRAGGYIYQLFNFLL